MSLQSQSNQRQKVSLPDWRKELGLPPVAPPDVKNWRGKPPEWWSEQKRKYDEWLEELEKLQKEHEEQLQARLAD